MASLLQAAHLDDRHDPSESPQDCREPPQKGGVPRRIGPTKGGLNSKLHAVVNGDGKPLIAKPVIAALIEPAHHCLACRG